MIFNNFSAGFHVLQPTHYLSEIPQELLLSYVSDYLKEEVANEGLVCSLPSFARFLDLSALSDTEIVDRVTSDHMKGIRAFIKEFPKTKRKIIISREKIPRTTEDQIEILPYTIFANKLWNHEIIKN